MNHSIPQPSPETRSFGGVRHASAVRCLLVAVLLPALLLVVFMLGWLCAHKTVAIECERLGGFYVGSAVFQCARTTSPPLRGATKFEGML